MNSEDKYQKIISAFIQDIFCEAGVDPSVSLVELFKASLKNLVQVKQDTEILIAVKHGTF